MQKLFCDDSRCGETRHTHVLALGDTNLTAGTTDGGKKDEITLFQNLCREYEIAFANESLGSTNVLQESPYDNFFFYKVFLVSKVEFSHRLHYHA